jgi:hypothetical protein
MPSATPVRPPVRGGGRSAVVAAALVLALLGAGLIYLERLHRSGVERPVSTFLSPPDAPAR